MIWRYNQSCELYQWSDDEKSYFVFNALSGQTHVLSRLSLDTIDMLKQQAINEKDIINNLSSFYEDFDSDDNEIYQHVLDMLASLDNLGLIEPFCRV
jgi:PqqD family protein of HPr-rel-A system